MRFVILEDTVVIIDAENNGVSVETECGGDSVAWPSGRIIVSGETETGDFVVLDTEIMEADSCENSSSINCSLVSIGT